MLIISRNKRQKALGYKFANSCNCLITRRSKPLNTSQNQMSRRIFISFFVPVFFVLQLFNMTEAGSKDRCRPGSMVCRYTGRRGIITGVGVQNTSQVGRLCLDKTDLAIRPCQRSRLGWDWYEELRRSPWVLSHSTRGLCGLILMSIKISYSKKATSRS